MLQQLTRNKIVKSISKLQKEASKAPKYVLKMEGLELYIAENQVGHTCNITPDLKKALKFSVGFDNQEMKVGGWTATAQLMSNCKGVKFEVMFL